MDHAKEIRDSASDYKRLFALVKGKLAKERGFIAVTRMSRERLFALADRIVADLLRHRGGDRARAGRRQGRAVSSAPRSSACSRTRRKLDESIDQEVRRTLSTYSRPVPEGSAEWEVLYQKTRDEVYRRRFRL